MQRTAFMTVAEVAETLGNLQIPRLQDRPSDQSGAEGKGIHHHRREDQPALLQRKGLLRRIR